MSNSAFSKIWIIVIIVIFVIGGFLTWQYLGIPKEEGETPEYPETPEAQSVPLATEDVFINHGNYLGQKFRFQGCFEPYKCTMAVGECNIDNLAMCCDCIKSYERCLIVDLQSVSREQLTEVRETNEMKYYVEVVGIVISSSKMRPVVINATDLTILGDCPTEKEECISLGEEISPEEDNQGVRCCSGLKRIQTSRYFYPCDTPGELACDENGCRIPPPTSDKAPWWQCTPCGNEICETEYGENRCNCPEDCE